ncbi:MAG: pyrroline-5-carboxylate reductase, partial [Rhizobium pusense]|nr:pyrroline-5-carboxylate reductase [Agrobacterium pusense]
MVYKASGPLVLVGAGNMGGAMLSGWLKKGVPGSQVIVVDPRPSDAMRTTITEAGAAHSESAPEGVKAGILFVAVKPQMMEAVLPSLKPLLGPETVVVSIAAGTTIATFVSHFGAIAAVRAMPNTPAMVGRGVTGAYANELVTPELKAVVDGLLKVSGPVEWVDAESDIDAVTAVSGSGPAYV